MMRVVTIKDIQGQVNVADLKRTDALKAILALTDVCFANKVVMIVMVEAHYADEHLIMHAQDGSDLLSEVPVTLTIESGSYKVAGLSAPCRSVFYAVASMAIFEKGNEKTAADIGFRLNHFFLFSLKGCKGYWLDGSALQALAPRCNIVMAENLSQSDIVNSTLNAAGRPIQVIPGEGLDGKGVNYFHDGDNVNPVLIMLHDIAHVAIVSDMDDMAKEVSLQVYTRYVAKVAELSFYPKVLNRISSLLWLLGDSFVEGPHIKCEGAHPLARLLFFHNSGKVSGTCIDYYLFDRAISESGRHFTAEMWLVLLAIRESSGVTLTRSDLAAKARHHTYNAKAKTFDPFVNGLIDAPEDLLAAFPRGVGSQDVLKVIASLVLVQELNSLAAARGERYSIAQVFDVVKHLELKVLYHKRRYVVSAPGYKNVVDLLKGDFFDCVMDSGRVDRAAKKWGLKVDMTSVKRTMTMFKLRASASKEPYVLPVNVQMRKA